MRKKHFLFLSLLFPVSLLAQSTFSHCDRVFTKVENLPSLRISNEAFGDSLSTTLKSKRFRLKENEITCRFVVTKESGIDDLVTEPENISKEKILKETILQFADFWKPATQNGHEVCAYVQLNLKIVDKKIYIEIMPVQSAIL